MSTSRRRTERVVARPEGDEEITPPLQSKNRFGSGDSQEPTKSSTAAESPRTKAAAAALTGVGDELGSAAVLFGLSSSGDKRPPETVTERPTRRLKMRAEPAASSASTFTRPTGDARICDVVRNWDAVCRGYGGCEQLTWMLEHIDDGCECSVVGCDSGWKTDLPREDDAHRHP